MCCVMFSRCMLILSLFWVVDGNRMLKCILLLMMMKLMMFVGLFGFSLVMVSIGWFCSVFSRVGVCGVMVCVRNMVCRFLGSLLCLSWCILIG